MRRAAAVAALTVLAAACRAAPPADPAPDPAPTGRGALAPEVRRELDEVLTDPQFLSRGDIPALGRSGDQRVAWPLVDLLRFHEQGAPGDDLARALAELTGHRPARDEVAWVSFSDDLLVRDVPAPPGYLRYKRRAYLATDPSWAPFFDPGGDLDWREVSWGGVVRDAIESLVDPPVVPAGEGGWLRDDDVVFGVTVAGHARAYPRRVMEVHELANDTVAGRRIALSYCTLCGAAIAYRTNGEDGRPLELRTSGLLQRSNKLMYDVGTSSLWDQFDGVAVTGPLRGTKLDRVPVVVSTWGEWRRAHPEGTVIAEGAGTGRDYGADFLGGRDAQGPIFPVGPRDDRLPPQTVVLGVETARGSAVAFPAAEARRALEQGRPVTSAGVEVSSEAGGLVARTATGGPLPAHEAYWFAWSQFRPDTALWSG